MEGLTYSLFGNDITPDNYYYNVSLMTDEMLELFNGEQTIVSFQKYVMHHNLEPMDRLIYILEFLMIGIMWRSYGSRGSFLYKYGGEALSRLYSLKHRGKRARERQINYLASLFSGAIS